MPFISGFQGLVNGWIKVNSKHVVITNTTADAATTATHASSRRGGQGKVSDNDSQGLTSTFASTNDPEISAIKKYNSSKRNRRKLERSVSLTDLLREMANAKEKELKHQSKVKSSESVTTLESGRRRAAISTSTPSDIALSVDDSSFHAGPRDDQSMESLRFVAGFFGADIPPPPPSPQSLLDYQRKQQAQQHQHQTASMGGQSQYPGTINTTGKSPIAAVHKTPPPQQQYDPPRQQHHHRSSMDVSDSATSLRSTHRSDSMCFNNGAGASQQNFVPPSASMRATPPLHPIGQQQNRDNDSRSKHSNPMQQFFKNLPGASKRCGSCDDYECRLLAMAVDMDYLRSEALRNEYTCRECRNEPSSSQRPPAAILDTKPEVAVSTSSHRLADMEVAHLEQMEQQAQERSRWQQDMHYKLSKFATIAKDLNEESALRKQESFKLADELLDVKTGRDLLALEVDHLRAGAAQHEVERIEHQALKEIIRKYEVDGIVRAKEIVDQRDSTILDLTSKLERAMGMVEIERMKQRKRRQIIFPSRVSHSGLSALHPIADDAAAPTTTAATLSLAEQLRLAKEQAHAAQIKLELSQGDAIRTGAAFQARLENLEKRLDAAESAP